MAAPLILLAALRHCFFTAMIVFLDFGRLVAFGVRTRRSLAAENLFLRKQLALFQERKVKPRRADDSTRWMMAALSRMFAWRDALWNVKPDTLIRWHPKGVRLFWRWKSNPTGRPRLPKDPPPDPRDGSRKCDMGRGANRQRTEAEARHPGIAPHCRKVSALWWTGAHTRSKAALADLRPQPCQGYRGLRLLRCGHRHVSHTIRIRRHRTGHPQNYSSQCDRPPDGGMDRPTVPGSAPGWSCVSIRPSRPGQHFL